MDQDSLFEREREFAFVYCLLILEIRKKLKNGKLKVILRKNEVVLRLKCANQFELIRHTKLRDIEK